MANLLNWFFSDSESDEEESQRVRKTYKARRLGDDNNYRQLYRFNRENVEFLVNQFLPQDYIETRGGALNNMLKMRTFLRYIGDPGFQPKAVFFTCMDSRMIPTRFTETHVGDMFVVRNAGNVIPHSHHFIDEYFSCEPAALELGCIVNNIRHIIVCGHSDCKAMNLLYELKDPEFSSQDNRRLSPLRSWLCTHALSSLQIFLHWSNNGMRDPIIFSSETPLRKFVAYVDPENKFSIEDKLSQVNTLQQLSNIASYGFLKRRLEQNDLHIHALWFDIYTGDIYFFSRGAKRFIPVEETTVDMLLIEIRRYYS